MASSQAIEVYARIRPHKDASPDLIAVPEEAKIELNIAKDQSQGYVNNQKEHFDFKFSHVFHPSVKQDEVFEAMAKKCAMGVLEGYNSTIFAYGQTGSGKTFTITGGPEKFADRGIIPRTLTFMFSEFKKRHNFQYSCHVSYLEIYNEVGYDLLSDERGNVNSLDDLPRVSVREDEDGNIHLGNLSAPLVQTEEEALNLLFLGDTNRMMAETPSNPNSTRSHCIFTISIESRPANGDVVRKSKLHLVDLAGSERIAKTGIAGDARLREAKYINLSLHYLEQVIVALQERAEGKNRGHIPYRNSMMTSILRDSLGGNCRTVMVATLSAQTSHLDETISTCRFAHRVMKISNRVELNEEVDPYQLIRRLKQEIRELREELAILKGGPSEGGPVTEDELQRLRQLVRAYVDDPAANAELTPGTMSKIRACYAIFRELLLEAQRGGRGEGPPSEAVQEQLRKMKLLLQQRDNEINILVNMLKKRGPEGAPQASASQEAPGGGNWGGAAATYPERPNLQAQIARVVKAPSEAAGPGVRGSRDGGLPGPGADAGAGEEFSAEVLMDRTKAFELFRKSYRKNEVMEENKALLRQKYAEAKQLGEEVNLARSRINEYKALVEQLRVERAMQGLLDKRDGEGPADPEEERVKNEIEREKARYKDGFARLRDLKSEIEQLQALLEKSRDRLQKDFEQWYALMAKQTPGMPAATSPGRSGSGTQRSAAAAASPRGRTSPTPPLRLPRRPRRPGLRRSPAPAAPHYAAPAAPPTPPSHRRRRRVRPSPQYAYPPQQQYPANPPAAPAAYPPGGPAGAAGAGPALTGNAEADADILAFYKARAELLAGTKR
eukprot:tig00001339_g8258.t1